MMICSISKNTKEATTVSNFIGDEEGILSKKLQKSFEKLHDAWSFSAEDLLFLIQKMNNGATDNDIEHYCRNNGVSARASVSLMDAYASINEDNANSIKEFIGAICTVAEEATNYWIKRFDF